MDGDGDLDLAVGNEFSVNQVYENQGNGSFNLLPNALGPDILNTRSVVWGDMDGDGDLDLAVGNGDINQVYVNQGNGNFSLLADALGPDALDTWSLTWGDMDDDGDLDLAVGNVGSVNQVYENQGNGSFSLLVDALGPDTLPTRSLAWGDMDGDGDLDLAVGNWYSVNQVYVNQGNGSFSLLVDALGPDTLPTTSIAWGDMNGDGDLDLIVGNSDINQLFVNQGNGNFGQLADALGLNSRDTRSVAWGDMDGDGDLDLAVGNWNDVNQVYENERQGGLILPNNPPYPSLTRPITTGNANYFSTPALLEDRIIPLPYALFDPEEDPLGRIETSYSLNGGGQWFPATATTNTLTTNLTTGLYPTQTVTNTHVFAWDTFASGFFGQSDNVVIRMVAYPQPDTAAPNGTYRYTNTVAGPYQRSYASAQTFPFRVRGTQVRVFSQTLSSPVENVLVYRLPAGQNKGGLPLLDGGGTAYRTDPNGYLRGRGTIGVGDTLYALAPVVDGTRYAGGLFFDGGTTQITGTTTLSALNEVSVSMWMRSDRGDAGDILFAYGGSDFTISNLNDLTIGRDGTSVTTGISLTNGLWQHLTVSWRDSDDALTIYKNGLVVTETTLTGASLPANKDLELGQDTFGLVDEVRLWDKVLSQSEVQATMFSRLKGQEAGLIGWWSFDDNNQQTALDYSGQDNHLTLSGATWYGQRLGGYTIYHTNLEPAEAGLGGHTISQPGVQAITVTAQHPLILFDLSVSLEWDARQDTLFLEQLKFDLKRASEVLFDATNGQAALGQIVLYHDRQHWSQADIQIHASNALRPHATIGGFRQTIESETITANPYALPDQTQPYSVTYGPGRVSMGSVWNRFGEASGTLGEDWPRTLAHELGHYLFSLYDNYIGYENGVIVPVVGCDGTLMSNPYLEDYSEFRDNGSWEADCRQTLSAQTTGRSDWETITTFYPWLTTPTKAITGPNGLPLVLTQIVEGLPPDEPQTLEVPIFFLTKDGASIQLGNSAQAVLYQDERMIDLGRPSQDKVRTWGASPGDELCLYDPSANLVGCKEIAGGDDQLALSEVPDWQPDIIITPVNSTTIAVTVTTSLPLSLQAKLYPSNQFATKTITLTQITNKVYRGEFSLPAPAGQGTVRVWVDEPQPRREAVTSYALGGNPGSIGSGFSFASDGFSFASDGFSFASDGFSFASDGFSFASDGFSFASDGFSFASDGFSFASDGFSFLNDGFSFASDGFSFASDGFSFASDGFAPAFSPDGQVVLFGQVDSDIGQFYAMQKAGLLPGVPSWVTVVGDGYRLTASPDAPDFTGTSISFRYQGKEVPPGEEPFLTIHYYEGGQWQRLPTALNPVYNEASAASRGPGLYALFSSIDIPLASVGWNLLAYPAQQTTPISQALQSIEGLYLTVYHYDGANQSNPWQVYSVGAPEWVNDLQQFEFGQAYWINVTQAATVYFKGNSPDDRSGLANVPSPPATYYGRVIAGNGFNPTAGMAVIAKIGGQNCGQTQLTQDQLGGQQQVVYVIDVWQDDGQTYNGCGLPGRTVTFEVGGQALNASAIWSNSQVWRCDLGLEAGRCQSLLYLPLMHKDGGGGKATANPGLPEIIDLEPTPANLQHLSTPTPVTE